MKYPYLHGFIESIENPRRGFRNWFIKFDLDEIEEAEKKLELTFPCQLKEFYEEIGYGSLSIPEWADETYKFYGSNRINSPDMIIDTLNKDPNHVSEEDIEFPPGAIPFFEIADGCQFLLMYPLSDTPNAVYTETGILIEKEFEHFIWRLFYEDPGYYGNIIEAHYNENP